MPKDALTVPHALAERYRAVRTRSLAYAEGLSEADMTVQTMDDVSPMKWHLAHTTWFWETFLLQPRDPDYAVFDARFNYLFNSYYEQVGERHPRPSRGLLTRPGVNHVRAYRAHVDAAATQWLEQASEEDLVEVVALIETGLAHEQQHQELMLTDIKHVLGRNPFGEAAYGSVPAPDAAPAPAARWVGFDGGLHEFGHDGQSFAFDCEGPRHKAYLAPYALASRPVTNAEYRAFIEDGGYRTPTLWLSDGWAAIQAEGRRAPLYWRERNGDWREYTLHGEGPLDPHAPVCHLDFYEASAYAEWAGARLPTELEWELASQGHDPDQGRWAEPEGWRHPVAADHARGLTQMFGEVWEWTGSAYRPYPGYRPPEGAIGEYNGKFMSGQMVLRGGSCLTSPDHMRGTYRNFFPPNAQWQMTGVRLAKDV